METLDSNAIKKGMPKVPFFKRSFLKAESYETQSALHEERSEDYMALSYEARAKNALLGSYLKSTVIAVLFGLLGLTLGFAALLYTLVNTSSTSYLPYIITIDKKGALLGHDTLSDTNIPENARGAFVCDFIEALYIVSEDRDYQVRLIKSVYARLAKDTLLRSMVDSHYEHSETLFTGKKMSREVIIESLLRKSEKTYEVEYKVITKRERDRSEEKFKAMVVLAKSSREKRTLEDLRLNPLGLLVSHLDIHKKLISQHES